MQILHDPDVRSRLESRLEALSPDAERKWGSMTSDQMLWHVNQFLRFALGDGKVKPHKSSIPLPVMRFFVLYMPWPKGAPTHRSALAKTSYDFESERTQCLALIERFVSRPIDEPWPTHPAFGKVSGKFNSRLQVRHLDHHFRQFGG